MFLWVKTDELPNRCSCHLICEWLSQTRKLVGVELVELNPTADVRNQTAELGRWLIESALGRRIL